MPGGVWGQQFRASQTGGYGAPRPNLLSDYDRANSWMRGGGSASYYGTGSTAQQTRQFADVGKYNVNLLDPLDESRANTNYQPIDGADGGPLGGVTQYYDARTPGGLFAGVLGAIGEKVTGALGQPKLGSDIGTFLGKTIEAPMGIVGSASIAGVPFLAPVIDAANSEIEKYTPYILRDTLKIPKDVGGAFQSMLSIFGLAGTAVERTYAGLEGMRGSALPADIQARIDSGELTHDQALDELVLSSRGFTDDPMHNLVWAIVTDPANWVSLGVGAVGGAARATSKVAMSFGAAIRAGEEGALKAASLSPRLAEAAEMAKRGESLVGMQGLDRSLIGEMRGAIDNPRARLQLGMVERLGMSALGPVGPETGNAVARVGQWALRATDPVSFFSGAKSSMRSMQLISTAGATGTIAGYGALTVHSLAGVADAVTNGGSDLLYRSLGVNNVNVLQEVALSELATDAMKSGVIPRTGTLTPPEAVRELLRGGAYDANIGKYVEMLVEKNKDMAVGMMEPELMRTETINKFAEMLGVDPTAVAARMKSVSSDEAIAIHALYYYFKGEALHTTVADGLRAAKAAGQLASNIDPERIAVVSPKSVTKVTVKEIEDAVKTGDVGIVRMTVEKFNNFNWLHSKNVADKDLIAVVQNWLDSHAGHHIEEIELKDATGAWLPGIPKELRDWAMNAETHGYKLGQRMPLNVPEEDLWRITRHPDGTILNADPYSDFWAEGQDSAKKINRFNAIRMTMTRGIRQERIVWQQRRAFITDMSKAHLENGIDVPPALSERIFRAIMYEAKDRYLQPRGMEPREMYTAAKKVLDEQAGQSTEYADIAKRLTERQIVLGLLRATQGDIKLVGLTQRITGGVKAYAPGASANYWGRISERLFPLMRFTLNPVFQTMELTEPYILLAMRGIKLPLRRDSEGYQSALASRNGYNQLIRLTEGDADGLAAETAEALAVQAYQRTEANAKFGRNSWFGKWTPHVGERKDAALALQTRHLLGDNLYNAFKEIKGDEFEAFWADLAYEFGTHNRGQIAERWLGANFGVTNVDGRTVTVFDDILKTNALGKRFRLTPTGELGSYTFADVERVVDGIRESDGRWTQGLYRDQGLEPGEALIASLKGKSLEEWMDEVKELGMNSDSVTRITDSAQHDIWKMANGPELDEFYNGEKLPGGGRKDGYRNVMLQGVTGEATHGTTAAVWTRIARDTEVARLRAVIQGWAKGKGMTEEEYIKLHFDDIPRPLDPNAVAPAALREMRGERTALTGYGGWAEEALRHGEATTPLLELDEVNIARNNYENHPSEFDLTDAVDNNHLILRVSSTAMDHLMESISLGQADLRGMPSKGYSNVEALMGDVAVGDVALRVNKDNLDYLTDTYTPGIHHISKSELDTDNLEVLTETGWEPLTEARLNKITVPDPLIRETNSEALTGRFLYGGQNGRYVEAPEAGITELDLDEILQLPNEVKESIRYLGSEHRIINGYLRGLDLNDLTQWHYSGMTEVDAKNAVDAIDKAIQKGQLREPMTLYRGIDISSLRHVNKERADELANLRPAGPGEEDVTFTDSGFFSTSGHEYTAASFANTIDQAGSNHVGIIFIVNAPAGMHANLLVKRGIRTGLHENEHLLGRDIHWKVVKRAEKHSYDDGRTIYLTIEPVVTETLPGVKHLSVGELPGHLRNEGRFIEDAVHNPEGLRAELGKVMDEDEAEEFGADIETAIAKAEAAAPPVGRTTIGPVTVGRRTPDELIDEIGDTLDFDEITAAVDTIPDLRNRVSHITSSPQLQAKMALAEPSPHVRKVEEYNDDRVLSSIAIAAANEGGMRGGLRKVLQVMERFWALGPSGVTGLGVDATTQSVTSQLVRGVRSIGQAVHGNRQNDMLDVINLNTSRRVSGRTSDVQPIWHDDLSATAAGYYTPGVHDELVAGGHITAGVEPNMSGRIFSPGVEHSPVVLPGNPVAVGAPFGPSVRGTFDEPGFEGVTTAGVLIQEADGRVWIYEPKNHFGGYEHTWPKGRPDAGEDLRDAALREAQEEMGFTVELTGYVGDFDNVQGTSRARFYTAKRTGGGPAMGNMDETEAIKLVPPEGARDMLIHDDIPDARDQAILEALEGLKPSQAAPPAVVPPTHIPTGPMEPTGAYLGGTTGPRQVRDPDTGKLYVEKRGASPGHVREESTADSVYEAAGVPVAAQTMLDGGTVKRAEMIEGGTGLDELWGTPEFDAAKVKLQDDFAVDAWMANWDVIGLDGDNIIVKDGVPYRIDNGGALRYRAQGEPKSTMHPTPSLTAPQGGMWGPEVSEINKMRSGGNTWQKRVYGDLPDAEVARQVIELGEKLDTLLEQIPEELRPLMRQRYDDMVRQMEGVTPAPPRAAVAPTAPGIARPAPLGEYEHEWMTKFYNDAAKRANEIGFNGKSTWTAGEMSIVASRAQQKMGRVGGGTPMADELELAMPEIHLAIAPGGPGTDLEDMAPILELFGQKRYRAQKHRLLRHASETASSGLRDTLGAIVESTDEVGVGLFDDEIPQPLMSHFLLNTPEHGQSLAEALAFITGQPKARMWTPGLPAREIKDFKTVTARAVIALPPSDITPKMAERIAQAIGKRWPEADDLIATRGANRSWHLQIKDTDGKLFPRLESGEVDINALHTMLDDILSDDEMTKLFERVGEGGEKAGFAVDYGHVFETKPPVKPDGSIDWDAYAATIEQTSTANGSPIRASQLHDLRASYNDVIRDQVRYAAPEQYSRRLRDEPIVGRDLEDRRGGNLLGTTTPSGAGGPGSPVAGVVRGLAAADPLTGLHELIHVFSIAGMDPSMRNVISQAFDEFHVGNDAAKAAKLNILKGKLAATTHNRGGAQTRLKNEINALEQGLRTPHPSTWGTAHEEFFVDLVYEYIRRHEPPNNPDLANAFEHFRNWLDITEKELDQPGMTPIHISPAMKGTLDKMFAPPGRETVSYSVEQQTLRMAGQQALRSSMDEAHTTQFYKKDRSMFERSINHPYIGLYPASYMWGKILPEMLRFLALRPFGMETPFLMWNVAREVSDSVNSQAELDTGFKKFLDDNKDAFMLFSMMFPGLPHDIPANASLPLRRIAEQGLEHQQAFAHGASAESVGDIDFGKGAMDAVQYAVGPLGTIRTVTEVAGMSGDFARSLAGQVISKDDSELLSVR